MTPSLNGTPRLLVIGDIERLGPIVRRCFAPMPIIGVRSLLAGIAETRQSPTRAILVSYDQTCRMLPQAIAALKTVAGNIPVVLTCDPAHESFCRKLVGHGVDDYLIFPPDPAELERALALPTKQTQQRWIDAPVVVPAPSAEELARLADVLPLFMDGDPAALDGLAALVRTALNAEQVAVVLEGVTGFSGPSSSDRMDAVLVDTITATDKPIGQIRVGRCRSGTYKHEDTLKLRHYAVLIGRMTGGSRRAEAWRRLAMTDDLTGLPNRRRLIEFLDEKLAIAARTRTTVTVLYFDIDDFKRYNDTYGHDAGDEILRDIGSLFVKCSRESDLVARHGGDEFVVVFWDPGGPRTLGSRHPEQVLDVVKRFRDALKSHTFQRLGAEATGCLTISGGIAHYPWDARTSQELIDTADRALLQAKGAGKNRFWLIGDGDVAL